MLLRTMQQPSEVTLRLSTNMIGTNETNFSNTFLSKNRKLPSLCMAFEILVIFQHHFWNWFNIIKNVYRQLAKSVLLRLMD